MEKTTMTDVTGSIKKHEEFVTFQELEAMEKNQTIEVLRAIDCVKVCFNCSSYGWCDRDWKPTKVSSCSQCGWMTYCSKVCQLEHWKKVHNKHCKFLVGKAVKQNSRHSQDTCPKCKIEIQIGHKNIARADNPCYPCHLNSSFSGISEGEYKLHHFDEGGPPIMTRDFCIPLGEVTGHYMSNHERQISILQQLFYKISAVYPVAVRKGDFFREIFTSLAMLRKINWHFSMVCPTEYEIDYQMSSNGLGREQMIMMKLLEVHNSMMKEDQEDGVFKWWSSFLLFIELRQSAQYFYRSVFELQKLSDESFDKFNSKLNLKEVVRGNNFFQLWETLLASVSNQMLPFSDLIKVLCDGQVERKCKICAKNITVTTFFPQFHYDPDSSTHHEEASIICKQFVKGKCFVILRPTKVYCCLSKECFEIVCEQVGSILFRLMTEGTALAQRFVEHRCDACFRVNDKGHRCSSCKTKVYCSPECQDKDWIVHKLCCRELVNDKENFGRKKKGDTEKRTALGVDRMNAFSFGASYDI